MTEKHSVMKEKDIAKKMGVSQQRISQIIISALRKLKKRLIDEQ